MSKINIITAPDILYNQNKSFLLIFPTVEIRNQFQKFLEQCQQPLNVYLYAPQTVEEKDISWLLAISKIADYTILNLDNTDPEEKKFSSYLISLPNTFYLTKDEYTPYNKLSLNKIYDLDWLFDIETERKYEK